MSKEKETYQQIMEECMKNVDQYINDINILIEGGSYGHAFSLAVIAREEVTKAFANSVACVVWRG